MSEKKPTLKERLESYYSNRKEIDLLYDQAETERNRTEIVAAYQTSDKYTFSQKERIEIGTCGSPVTVADLCERRRMLIQECENLDKLVFAINDSKMRQILTIGYIMTDQEWEKVADHFGRPISGRAYKQRARRFLEKK